MEEDGDEVEEEEVVGQVLAELGDRYLQDGQMSWEYLMVTATRVD